MKAMFFRGFGGPEVLEYGELPDPAPGPGEVVIDIHAASVNAADWKMRKGEYAAMKDFPHVPGRELHAGPPRLVQFAGEHARDPIRDVEGHVQNHVRDETARRPEKISPRSRLTL